MVHLLACATSLDWQLVCSADVSAKNHFQVKVSAKENSFVLKLKYKYKLCININGDLRLRLRLEVQLE